MAENAAKVADAFALGGRKPSRYVVYLAPKQESQEAVGPRILGASWTTVESTCLAYARKAVGG